MNLGKWLGDLRRPSPQPRPIESPTDAYLRGRRDGANDTADIAKSLGVDPFIVRVLRAGAR